jgi:biopolymer transport protein ExbB/TolQ
MRHGGRESFCDAATGGSFDCAGGRFVAGLGAIATGGGSRAGGRAANADQHHRNGRSAGFLVRSVRGAVACGAVVDGGAIRDAPPGPRGSQAVRAALQVCQENGSPISDLFAHGVRKWGKSSVEVEQAIIDGGERQVAALRSNLRVFNAAYSVGPLLGLLGTTWGMLLSFERLANAGAMGNSQQLAAGIALALVTTAAGLAIAIPSILLYMYFAGRVDSLVAEMDSLSQRLVHAISSEGLAERASRPKRVHREAPAPAPPQPQPQPVAVAAGKKR